MLYSRKHRQDCFKGAGRGQAGEPTTQLNNPVLTAAGAVSLQALARMSETGIRKSVTMS